MGFSGKNIGVGCHFLLQGQGHDKDQIRAHAGGNANRTCLFPRNFSGNPTKAEDAGEDVVKKECLRTTLPFATIWLLSGISQRKRNTLHFHFYVAFKQQMKQTEVESQIQRTN